MLSCLRSRWHTGVLWEVSDGLTPYPLRGRPIVRALRPIRLVLRMQPQQIHIAERVPAIRIEIDPARMPKRVRLNPLLRVCLRQNGLAQGRSLDSD